MFAVRKYIYITNKSVSVYNVHCYTAVVSVESFIFSSVAFKLQLLLAENGTNLEN